MIDFGFLSVASILCWMAVFGALLIASGIYVSELRRHGGIGLVSIVTASILTYNLLNPALYLISPGWATKFAEYIGSDQPPEVLLPNLLSTTIFLFAVWLSNAIARVKRRVPITVPRPLRGRAVHLILFVSAGTFLIGAAMYLARNWVVFGNPFGSVTAKYAGDTARPQVVVLSAYITFWIWAMQAALLLILWQVAARQWRRFTLVIPIGLASLHALLEGDRALIGTVVLMLLGWFGYRAKITLKNGLAALLIVTLLGLMANARYQKETQGLWDRIQSIFDPQYFRPFWSSDPSGPSVVATLASWRATQEGYDLGSSYLLNLAATVPRSIWHNKPEGGTERFARWYEESHGQTYVPGTGYAFNAVTEAFINFWYLGPLLLGFACGTLFTNITDMCVRKSTLIGRASFCYLACLFAWSLPRSSVTVFFAPLSLATYLIIFIVLRLCESGSFWSTASPGTRIRFAPGGLELNTGSRNAWSRAKMYLIVASPIYKR